MVEWDESISGCWEVPPVYARVRRAYYISTTVGMLIGPSSTWGSVKCGFRVKEFLYLCQECAVKAGWIW